MKLIFDPTDGDIVVCFSSAEIKPAWRCLLLILAEEGDKGFVPNLDHFFPERNQLAKNKNPHFLFDFKYIDIGISFIESILGDSNFDAEARKNMEMTLSLAKGLSSKNQTLH